MRYILLVSIFILVLTTNAQDEEDEKPDDDGGPGVMCYECTVGVNTECVSLASFKSRYTFLKSCKTGCAVRLGEYGQMGEYDKSVVLSRGCSDMEKCEESNVNCCTCDYDGCNINNYCNTANALHPKVVAAIIFCFARHSLVYML